VACNEETDKRSIRKDKTGAHEQWRFLGIRTFISCSVVEAAKESIQRLNEKEEKITSENIND
jgi:hypothetical protein